MSDEERSTPPQDPREQLQEKILAEHKRLGPEDAFKFSCHPGISCFNQCCGDVNIFLSPYDVLRMKRRLGMKSEEFLEKRVLLPVHKGMKTPVVMLRMKEDEAKSCPFLTEGGCGIYADRPWACRIYPLQPESNPQTEKAGKTYYSIMDVPFCQGLAAERTLSLAHYIEQQCIPVYMAMEALLKRITASERLKNATITNKTIQEMFFMASYDLDRFRRFVLESTFLKRFDVAPQTVAAIKTDDVALYRLAVNWLEYGLLAQQVLKVKPAAMAAKKAELGLK